MVTTSPRGSTAHLARRRNAVARVDDPTLEADLTGPAFAADNALASNLR
jgi:hypothetical protein